MLEVVLRWGDDTVDVQYVDNYEVAGIPLVRDGQILGDSHGHIGLVAYAIEPAKLPARSLRYTRGDDRRVLPYAALALMAHLAVWHVATETHPVVEEETVTMSGEAARPMRRARVTAPPAYAANPNGIDTPKRQAIASRGQRGAASRVGASTGRAKKHSSTEAVDATAIAGMLEQVSSDRIAAITGKLDLAGAMAKADLGGQVAMANSFGTSFGGFGGGGGGTGWGTIGTGRYGSINHGTGDGMRYSGGHYDGGYHYYVSYRRPRVPTLTITHFETHGELDKAIARRYVKRHIDKLSYCFESHALTTPSLDSASVHVTFTIMRDGHVEDATGETIYSDEIATCVTSVVNNIEFPRGRDAVFTLVKMTLFYKRST